MKVGTLLVVALVAACASPAESERTSPTLTASSTASPGTPATPSVHPPMSSAATFNLLPVEQPIDFDGQITCTGLIGRSDPVALVWLTADDPSVGATLTLRDYSDWTNPRTVCTFISVSVPQLIDAHHVVISWEDAAYAVVDLPDVEFHWFALPPYSAESSSTLIAVSPRLDQVAWLKERPGQSATMREIHVTTAAGDNVIASLPDHPTGFCGVPLDGSKPGAYSLSGEHLYVLDQGHSTTADYSLRVVEGLTTVLEVVPPSGGWPSGGHPAMAVWSPTSETLYYRQGNTVWRWTSADGVGTFLSNVSWSAPTITPNGKHLAYWIPGSDGTGEVYLADLESGASPRLIGQARQAPIFLNDAQLWYISTPLDHGCAGLEGGPTIYNVTDGSEAPSIIEQVRGVWPAVTSAY